MAQYHVNSSVPSTDISFYFLTYVYFIKYIFSLFQIRLFCIVTSGDGSSSNQHG